MVLVMEKELIIFK